MSKKLLSLYGLKWNPFAPELPAEALWASPKVEHFVWRMQSLVKEGGFALITGEVGSGKSGALRVCAERLRELRDVRVGILSRPQSGAADFYREMGELFLVELRPHNRWAGFQALRAKWQAHIEATLMRPVLLIDEAQQMSAPVLSELRLLMSADFDSRALLTVVLTGDGRLGEMFRSAELLPLASRIRVRLTMEPETPARLAECLRHALEFAGAPKLMTDELITTLAEHAAGNTRLLMTLGCELLAEGARRELPTLDEKLYFELYAPPATPRPKTSATGLRR